MKRIDNREFVISFLNSETIDEVAKAMNIKRTSVISKTNTLRKRGVNLPRKFRNNTLGQLEVAQLNSLIRKHLDQK